MNKVIPTKEIRQGTPPCFGNTVGNLQKKRSSKKDREKTYRTVFESMRISGIVK